MSKKYLYCRVSTKKQLEGNGLADQASKLLDKYPDGIVIQEQYTGKKDDRPKFQEMLSKVKPGDTIAVVKIDRFSRNIEDGVRNVRELREKGVSIDILNMGLIENNPIGDLMVNMLFAFAQFERDMIVERTQSGREYARENKEGYKEGRKTKITPQKEKMVLSLIAQGLSYREIQEQYGINRGLVYKIVQADKASKMTDKLNETINEYKEDLFNDTDEDELIDFD